PETLAAIIRDDTPPLGIAVVPTGRELQQILNRCLAKSPHDRYASTRDLARDLRDLRNRMTAGGDSTERSLRMFRMNAPRLPVIASVAAVLLVLTAATMLLTRKFGADVAPTGPKSLAIVPFRDLSGTPDGQILSDGISEMISARIAQARGLRVIAPFDSTPQQGDPLEFARRRGASMVLTGRGQHAGEGLRVSFQVQDAITGLRVAGDMVTAQTADVFTLEDLVADSVLQALNVSRARPIRVASALTGKDQRTYAEAIGLLQRFTD